jgi:staphylococcal nuclease domain-containing protein 1
VSPVEPKYEVYFIDFGNKEKLPSERVRTIDAALSAVPPQARPAALAYLKVCTHCLLCMVIGLRGGVKSIA